MSPDCEVAMGLYSDRVLPHLVDRTCGNADIMRRRAPLLAGLSGVVLEIGFGSGLNMELYPAAVTKVFAVEPALRAHRLAEPRIDRSGIPVEVVGLDAARIDLGDETCDGAVSTFTLCTIPDVASALAEVLRVLRPGGRFHLLEHGLSPDPRVAGRQRFFDPIEQRVAGGCHLTREPRSLVEDAGFVVDHAETGYAKGPKPWTWLTAATAHKP